MKKIYTTILFVFALVAITNAQSTIVDINFSDASYDAAPVVADLDAHPNWRAAHFVNAGQTWKADADAMADRISTGNNFTYAILNTPITGAVGDKITVTAVVMLGFDNQNFFNGDRNMLIMGLSAVAVPANNTPINGEREGVQIPSKTTGGAKVAINNAGGGAQFATDPFISQASKSAYEVIVEYTIGADAASSSKRARLRNVGSGETSAIESSVGMRSQIWDALTGSGAYYFNWALGFYENNPGNTILLQNSLLITKNTPTLSSQENTAFEFSTYPNPVKDILHINTKEPLQKVEVYDLLGKNVLSVKNVSEQINVSSLSKALYILKLTSANGVSTKKFLKE